MDAPTDRPLLRRLRGGLVELRLLVWLWRRGPASYRPARRALVVATLIALALYSRCPRPRRD